MTVRSTVLLTCQQHYRWLTAQTVKRTGLRCQICEHNVLQGGRRALSTLHVTFHLEIMDHDMFSSFSKIHESLSLRCWAWPVDACITGHVQLNIQVDGARHYDDKRKVEIDMNCIMAAWISESRLLRLHHGLLSQHAVDGYQACRDTVQSAINWCVSNPGKQAIMLPACCPMWYVQHVGHHLMSLDVNCQPAHQHDGCLWVFTL